jgi:hypothetical protein
MCMIRGLHDAHRTPDSRRMRVTSANPTQMLCGQQGMLLLDPSVCIISHITNSVVCQRANLSIYLGDKSLDLSQGDNAK